MKTRDNILSAIMMLVIGVLFIIWKDAVIGWVMTAAGVILIVMGIIDIIQKQYVMSVIKLVIGILVIVFGWLLVDVSLLILAVVLVVLGIAQIVDIFSTIKKKKNVVALVLSFVKPLLSIIIGGGLGAQSLMNFGVIHVGNEKFIPVLYLVIGIIFALDGLVALIGALIPAGKPKADQSNGK